LRKIEDGRTCLLRASAINQYERKQHEYGLMRHVAAPGIPIHKPVHRRKACTWYKTGSSALTRGSMLSSPPWAVPFGDEEIGVSQQLVKDVLAWYDNMNRTIRTWYSGE